MLEGTLSATVGSDGVAFSYTIENTGSDPVSVNYSDGQKFDIVVEADGDEAWRWSHGRMFTMALEQKTFSPGETATYEATWDDPDEGTYTATATCAANGHDARATTTVDI